MTSLSKNNSIGKMSRIFDNVRAIMLLFRSHSYLTFNSENYAFGCSLKNALMFVDSFFVEILAILEILG